MTEVYKALMALGCEWLQLSSYRIKCRWRPNIPRGATVPVVPGQTNAAAATDGADGTWNRGRPPTDMNHGMEMSIDGEENSEEKDEDCRMQVISGSDGHYVSVPNLCTPDYCIKIGLTLYKVQQSIYLLDFQVR
jgi:5'-AMP-activated protein kinase catalytic alpha subunit